MTVKYSVIPRRNPQDPDAPETYHPSVKSTDRVSLHDLAETIAEISTVSSTDTYAVLEALVSIIPKELARGNVVELGDLGSFFIRTKSSGAATEDDVSPKNIDSVLPRFYPGQRFKEVLSSIQFVKVDGS